MNFGTNQGVNGCFSITRETSKCIPVENGPIHHWKHSNWSNVDNYGNYMVSGTKDLSLHPNRVTPTSSISISQNFAEPVQNMCPQSSTFCTSLHVSPSSTLNSQMQFLQPGSSSSTEFMMPQAAQTMLPVQLQGENLAAYQRYEGQQVMNGGHSELLGDVIRAGTFDWATGRTFDVARTDNIISQQKVLQMQSKRVDFIMNHDNQNAQTDEIFTATEHSQIHGNHNNQANRSFTFSLEDETNSSISSIDALHKPRMRWTQKLHDCFVQAINDLGGADKATPKSVQMKMGVEGLTIYHVKSHLQKYRLARYQPETKEEKRSFISEFMNRSSTPEKESEPSKKSAPESEALRVQWELQKSLHEQLEFQRELQQRAEENARQLQKLLEEQKKVGEAFMLASQSFSSTNAAGPSSSTRLDLAQVQLNDRSNDASLRNVLHEGNEDMLQLGVRISPDSPPSPKKSRVEIGTSVFRY